MFARVFYIVYCILLLVTIDTMAQEKSKSKITGFVSIDIGAFSTSITNFSLDSDITDESITFDDLYGSSNGFVYGGSAGLGDKDKGFFLITKFRFWCKSGEPLIVEEGYNTIQDAEIKWKQSFYSLGLRAYMGEKKKSNYFMPFGGIGVAGTSAQETMKGRHVSNNSNEPFDLSATVNGVGYYWEIGVEYFSSPSISLSGCLENSIIKLDRISEINAGGVVFGLMLNIYFGEEKE